jgi:hypothetical protein
MNTVMINVRHDCNIADDTAHNGVRLVPSYPEPVDLDTLTPRARALAEAILDAGRAGNIVLETSQPPPAMSPERERAYGDAIRRHASPDGRRQSAMSMNFMRADSIEAAATFLERRARELPPGWYPVGAKDGPRVPSAEDAAADHYMTRDQAIEYMRDRPGGLSLQGWDTLRPTGHRPDPDRYASAVALWLPATIDAYLGREFETWPLSRVAEHLGFGGEPATAAGSARKQLSRWGLLAVGRAPGRGGESLYAADQVQAAHAHRPGRGKRTDLAPR